MQWNKKININRLKFYRVIIGLFYNIVEQPNTYVTKFGVYNTYDISCRFYYIRRILHALNRWLNGSLGRKYDVGA